MVSVDLFTRPLNLHLYNAGSALISLVTPLTLISPSTLIRSLVIRGGLPISTVSLVDLPVSAGSYLVCDPLAKYFHHRNSNNIEWRNKEKEIKEWMRSMRERLDRWKQSKRKQDTKDRRIDDIYLAGRIIDRLLALEELLSL